MYLSRIVNRGFRNFAHLDVPVADKVTCVVGENNTGKTNLVFAIRLALDAGLSSTYRNLTPEDFCSGTDISTPPTGHRLTGVQGIHGETAGRRDADALHRQPRLGPAHVSFPAPAGNYRGDQGEGASGDGLDD